MPETLAIKTQKKYRDQELTVSCVSYESVTTTCIALALLGNRLRQEWRPGILLLPVSSVNRPLNEDLIFFLRSLLIISV